MANSIPPTPLSRALKPSPTWGYLSSLLSQLLHPANPRMDARRSEVLLPRAQKKPEGRMASKFKSTYSFVRTLFNSWLHFFVIPGHSPVIWVSCGTAEATNSFSPCELYRCVRDQTYFREALLGGCPWGLNPSPICPLPSELGPDASLKQRSLLSSRSKT